MIKNIVFDCSDTLLRMGAPAFLASLTGDEALARKVHTTIFTSAAWYQYDNGKLTIDELERALLPLLDPAHHALARRYLAEWVTKYTVIPGTPELLQKLKDAGYRLYLLSDFPPCFEVLPRTFPFFSLFDGMMISYQVGVSKRDGGALFSHLLQRFDLRAEECAFVDDTPAYVAHAKAIGMEGYLASDLQALCQRLGLAE